jgi:exosortase J
MSSVGEAASSADSGDGAANDLWTLITASTLALAGLGLFWWQFAHLWFIWTTDSLRSVGVLAIPTSMALFIRTVGRDDFAAGGSWWGLALVALAVAGGNLQPYGWIALAWSRGGGFFVLPVGLAFYLYGSGLTILLGGARAWHRAGFALLLLLFVNPVPSFFTNLIDLPLQHLGAQTARSFASLMGVPVSGAALKVMFFHDELGMFIAPGCNGLQGAVAMGGLALVIGHLRGMRILPHLFFVIGAVALAYVFNLLRLCLLVLFYCLAHLLPVIGGYAVGADYLIGATLFVVAAVFLFGVSR